MEEKSDYGFEKKHRAKHFMIASGCATDTRMATFRNVDGVEIAYRLWARERVSEADIKSIRLLPKPSIISSSAYTLMIGNIATKEALYKRGLTHEEDLAYLDEGDRYICFHMALRPLFISEVTHRTIPYMALGSFKDWQSERIYHD